MPTTAVSRPAGAEVEFAAQHGEVVRVVGFGGAAVAPWGQQAAGHGPSSGQFFLQTVSLLWFAPAGPAGNGLIQLPPTLPQFDAGFLAARACAGTLPLRRLQLEADQVILYAHDGQDYSIPDVKDITGREIVDRRKTPSQLPQRVPPAGILATPMRMRCRGGRRRPKGCNHLARAE